MADPSIEPPWDLDDAGRPICPARLEGGEPGWGWGYAVLAAPIPSRRDAAPPDRPRPKPPRKPANTPTNGERVGIGEASRLLGISKARMRTLARRGTFTIIPDAHGRPEFLRRELEGVIALAVRKGVLPPPPARPLTGR
jgi:hypothetical protein